jgi:hypothetical protein
MSPSRGRFSCFQVQHFTSHHNRLDWSLDKIREAVMTTLADGLRCIAYDAAVLAMALRTLQRRACTEHDLGRKTDQLAVEAALIKYRSLIDFLTGATSRDDDIKITEFGEQPIKITDSRRNFKKSVNKYSAHLTWQRTIKDDAVAEFPRPRAILRYGPLLLSDIRDFLDRQIAKNVCLNNYGQAYYAKLVECSNELKDNKSGSL